MNRVHIDSDVIREFIGYDEFVEEWAGRRYTSSQKIVWIKSIEHIVSVRQLDENERYCILKVWTNGYFESIHMNLIWQHF